MTNTNKTSALITQDLTKLYTIARSKEKRTAVDQLNLAVQEGEIFGFLGPNGAGKTTTIKMLLSFVKPTSGNAWIFGQSTEDALSRKLVGYVPEQPYFPKFLTCLELVKEHGAMFGLSLSDATVRAKKCLTQVKMEASLHTPLSQLSKGMTQRVGLACALVGDPKLLILDEPSSGLDPVGRRELRDLLTEFKAEGKTIFVSSHLLSEMESVCDRVGIIALGKLVACGAPADIIEVRDKVKVEFDCVEESKLNEQIGNLGGEVSGGFDETRHPVQRALIPTQAIYNLINILRDKKATLHSVIPQRESLEDAFLRLVKGSTR